MFSLVIPLGAIFFFSPLHFRISHRCSFSVAKYATISFLISSSFFHTTLFCCPYAHPLSCTSLHTHYFLVCVLLLYPSIPYFLFLAAQPILLFYIVFSRLDSSFYQPRFISLPLPFLFRFLCRAPSFSLPTARICMRESNLGCYGKHNVRERRERERERGGGM